MKSVLEWSLAGGFAVLTLAVLALAAIGLISVCSSNSEPRSAVSPPLASPTPRTSGTEAFGGGGPAASPSSSPEARTTESTVTPSPPTPTPAPVAPTATAAPAPPSPPVPAPPTAVAPPVLGAQADFTGSWRIVDTITNGTGAGQTFSFDVTLNQAGSQISGGNAGLVLNGGLSGRTATVQFSQPSLGHTGTFVWSMDASGNAAGMFVSSVPNTGSSQLIRMP
jgi:hypothetical protein